MNYSVIWWAITDFRFVLKSRNTSFFESSLHSRLLIRNYIRLDVKKFITKNFITEIIYFLLINNCNVFNLIWLLCDRSIFLPQIFYESLKPFILFEFFFRTLSRKYFFRTPLFILKNKILWQLWAEIRFRLTILPLFISRRWIRLYHLWWI